MNDLKDRIHSVIEDLAKRGFDQVDLARAAGVTKGTVTHWLTGTVQSIKLEYALGIEAAFGINPIWLVLGKGQMRAQPLAIESTDRDALVAIRKVEFKISAGIAGFAAEYIDNGEGDPIFLPRRWVEKRHFDPAKLYATRVSGMSMVPTLDDTDICIVNTGDTERAEGAVYAFNYEGEFTVKRLRRDMRQWWLCSDNQDQRLYPRRLCDEDTFILGRIVLNVSESF